MSTAVLAGLGVSSAVVNTIGLVPYIKDIFRHKTKPERATWWIWLALNIIAFAAQAGAGATWSLFMTGAGIVAEGLIAFLSLSYGYGRFKRKDLVSLLIAMCGLILWKFTSDPLFALIVVLGIDLLGVGKLNFTQLLYPIYIMLANGLMVWIILSRRKQLT
jgi:hypothetical protein